MAIYEHVVVAEDNSFPGKGGTALTQKIGEQITPAVANKLEALTVGTVTTGAEGSSAAVAITGTAPNQTVNFTIPRGNQGVQGLKGDRGPAALDTGMRHSSKSYAIPAGGSVIIDDVDLPRSGSVFMAIDGNSPMPIWFQIYRSGTYNSCRLITPQASAAWILGDTAQPATGVWKIWVEGNTSGALLHLSTTSSYGRNVRFFWYELSAGTGEMGGATEGITIHGVVTTASALPTTGVQSGDSYLANDTGLLYIYDGTDWSTGVNIRGPQGLQGPDGAPGTTPTVGVGTVTTGAAGSSVSITEGGTATARTFNFTIPRGDTGSPGTNATITGATATGLAAGATPTVSLGGTESARTFAFGIPKGDKGDQGNPGTTPTVGVGTVTTGAAGSSVQVTEGGTSTARTFNFTIPRGDQGIQGVKGDKGEDLLEKKLGALYAGYSVRTAQPVGIVFAGSSTTEGSDQDPANRWVNKLIAQMQKAFPSGGGESAVGTHATPKITSNGIHGYNAGLSGTTSANYLTTTKVTQIGDIDPVAVVHMVGSNDYSTGMAPTTYRNNMTNWLNQLDAVLANPYVHILVHAQRRTDVTSPAYPYSAYRDVLKDLANTRSNCVFLDVSEAFEEAHAPMTDPLNIMKPDNVHLEILGHDFMYRLMAYKLGVPLAVGGSGSGSGLSNYIITSDDFNSGNITNIHGASLNANMGGRTDFTWTCDPQSYVGRSGGIMARQPGTAAWIVATRIWHHNVEMSYVITSLPTASSLTTVMRRAAATVANSPNDYRLHLTNAGALQLQKRVSGSTTSIASTGNGVVTAGSRITFRVYDSLLRVYVNGLEVISATDTSLPDSGWCGFSGVGDATNWGIDNLVISSVTN